MFLNVLMHKSKILRYETDRVLASPQFVFINTDGFVKILEQDGLAVPEIDLWRAAIKWAKHRANSEDGQMLRHQMSDLTKHLRPCAMTADQFCGEVVTTDILSIDEERAVSRAIGKKSKPLSLSDFSDEIEPRRKFRKIEDTLLLTGMQYETTVSSCSYNLTLTTNDSPIELLPLVCVSEDRSDKTKKVDCALTIHKVENSCSSSTNSFSSNDPPKTVIFTDENVNAKYGSEFEIPLVVDGKNITLLPHTKYMVMISLVGAHRQYYKKGSSTYYGIHFMLQILCSHDNNHRTPFTKLRYRATTEGKY